MTLYVWSDLHISDENDPLYLSLIRFINSQLTPGDILVLAGDIFDLFVGNKKVFKDRYSGFFEQLAEAGNRGVVIHYIEGNHDFLLREVFKPIPNITLHDENVSLEIEGKRFLISHGDKADPEDRSYLFLRKMLRSYPMSKLIAMAPGALVDWIGSRSAAASRDKRIRVLSDLPEPMLHSIRRIYRSYAHGFFDRGYDFVVLGHCHDNDEYSTQIGNRTAQYINVGYPRAHQSYLCYRAGEDRILRQAIS